jgi:hypothetical protein
MKNQKIANNSATSENREKVDTDLKSSGFFSVDVFVTNIKFYGIEFGSDF